MGEFTQKQNPNCRHSSVSLAKTQCAFPVFRSKVPTDIEPQRTSNLQFTPNRLTTDTQEIVPFFPPAGTAYLNHAFTRIPVFSGESPLIQPKERSDEGYKNGRLEEEAPIAQTKLKIGQPNDRYEQEADRIADQVVAIPGSVSDSKSNQTPLVNQDVPRYQRQTEPDEKEELELENEDEEETIRTKQLPNRSPQVSTGLQTRIQSMEGSGQPLPSPVRGYFEPRFGRKFSQVRIHRGAHATATAQALNARAFTHGRNIAFGAGQYVPESLVGRKLLAHELAHIVQQVPGIARYPVPISAPELQTRRPLWKRAIQHQPSLSPHVAQAPVFRQAVLKKIRDSLKAKRYGELFQQIRVHHGWLRQYTRVASGLADNLKDDARWYGLALYYYGPERNWPFPARFRPPNPVPNTKGKVFEMLRHLKQSERSQDLLGFFACAFPYGSQDFYLAKALLLMGTKGQRAWLLSLIKIYTGAKIKTGKFFDVLRRGYKTLKNDKEVAAILKTKFTGDAQWYGLALLHIGPESKWPPPFWAAKPNTKGKLFHALRLWRDNLSKIRDPNGVIKKPTGDIADALYRFVSKAFRFGDKIYARYLWRWGSEKDWDPKVVKRLAGMKGVQPVTPKAITGYKRLKGKPKGKAWVKLSYKDIDQNYLGDCALMAAIAAIAITAPKLLEKMIEIHPNDTVTVHFYDIATKQERFYINLLPGFPVRHGELYYAGVTKEKEKGKIYTEYWGALLEKAYAAWLGKGGGYWKLNKGQGVATVFWNLLGRFATIYPIASMCYFCRLIDYSYSSKITRTISRKAPAIGAIIDTALKDKRPVVLSTHSPPDFETMKPKQRKRAMRYWKKYEDSIEKHTGYFSEHGYAVVQIRGSKVRLYNPHGHEVKPDTDTKFLEKHFDQIIVGPKLDKWIT